MIKLSNRKIAAVYHFANGRVLVLDAEGKQMPEFMGRYDDVIEKIIANYDGDIHFAEWAETKLDS